MALLTMHGCKSISPYHVLTMYYLPYLQIGELLSYFDTDGDGVVTFAEATEALAIRADPNPSPSP
mgnify:CR=1 FL=1